MLRRVIETPPLDAYLEGRRISAAISIRNRRRHLTPRHDRRRRHLNARALSLGATEVLLEEADEMAFDMIERDVLEPPRGRGLARSGSTRTVEAGSRYLERRGDVDYEEPVAVTAARRSDVRRAGAAFVIMDPHLSKSGALLLVAVLGGPILAGVSGALSILALALKGQPARNTQRIAAVVIGLVHLLYILQGMWTEAVFAQWDVPYGWMVPAATVLAVLAYFRVRAAE